MMAGCQSYDNGPYIEVMKGEREKGKRKGERKEGIWLVRMVVMVVRGKVSMGCQRVER